MKIEIRSETIVHLSLSEKEAHWLRGYLQNYMGQDTEDPENCEMHKTFLAVLTFKLHEYDRATLLRRLRQ